MKNNAVKLSILLCFWIIGMLTANAGGRTVTVFTRDGSPVTGELISVRADGISVYISEEGISDEMLVRDPKFLINIPLSNIYSVNSQGRSYSKAGELIGTGAGLLVVALAGEVGNWKTVSIGTVSGGTLGGLIGMALSERDIELRTFDRKELTQLAASSRFPNQVPAGFGDTCATSTYGFTLDNQGRILSVIPGSPAFMANLHYKDRLVSVNSQALPAGSRREILQLVNSGDSLDVRIQRGDETIQTTLTR